jgi:hypothetical protein
MAVVMVEPVVLPVAPVPADGIGVVVAGGVAPGAGVVVVWAKDAALNAVAAMIDAVVKMILRFICLDPSV